MLKMSCLLYLLVMTYNATRPASTSYALADAASSCMRLDFIPCRFCSFCSHPFENFIRVSVLVGLEAGPRMMASRILAAFTRIAASDHWQPQLLAHVDPLNHFRLEASACDWLHCFSCRVIGAFSGRALEQQDERRGRGRTW